jgi:hypothetical protein
MGSHSAPPMAQAGPRQGAMAGSTIDVAVGRGRAREAMCRHPRVRRALIVALIAVAFGACQSSVSKPFPLGANDGGTGDAAQASWMVVLRLSRLAPSCGPVCPGGGHVSIRTLDGRPLVTRLQPGDPLCSDGCERWIATVRNCDAVPSSDSLAWDGTVYAQTTFSEATCAVRGAVGLACYQPSRASAGRYLAHMCAVRCTSMTTAEGLPSCSATGAEDCIDVPFEFPGPALVEASFPVAPADAGAVSVPCRNPSQFQLAYADRTSSGDIGLDWCASGAIRRRKAVVCPPVPTGPPGPCFEAHPACASDAECTSSPHGTCANSHGLLGLCGCFYGCTRDDECSPGSICICNTGGGECVAATCVDDASCPAGAVCASTLRIGMGYEAFTCQRSDDECLGDADCGLFARCEPTSGRRVCVRDCPTVPN